MIRFLNDETVGGYRHGKGAIATLDSVDEVALISRGDAESIDVNAIHPHYHFHGFAGNQVAGDSKFFDMSGINHGVRGVNLTDAQMFATAGYVSTINPATSLTDSVLRIPAINFDYSGGEKLIVWMLGKWTPEVGDENMIGDGYSTGVGQRGWTIRAMSTGKAQMVVRSPTGSGFGGAITGTPFDGTLRSFGLVLDGQARKYCMWVDDAVDAFFGADYIQFSSGTDFDTLSSNTVSIGTSVPAPGDTTGIATAVRACVILRLPASYAVPPIASMTAAFKQLRANPGKLLLASAF